MAKGLINAAGGLSAADKETARQWMVEGHDILRGKVAGSIPRKAAATYTPGTSDQVLAAGQYLEGAQTIAGDASLVADNIRSGVNIFGVTGNFLGAQQAASIGPNSPRIWLGFDGTYSSEINVVGERYSIFILNGPTEANNETVYFTIQHYINGVWTAAESLNLKESIAVRTGSFGNATKLRVFYKAPFNSIRQNIGIFIAQW